MIWLYRSGDFYDTGARKNIPSICCPRCHANPREGKSKPKGIEVEVPENGTGEMPEFEQPVVLSARAGSVPNSYVNPYPISLQYDLMTAMVSEKP
jgi:hypothetical protein